MTEIILKEEVYAIVGAAMEVHRILGCGFLEPVYQEALEIELTARGIPYTSQQVLPISYKGQRLKKTYVADFVIFGNIIVEIKALDCLSSREEAQVINYLKSTGIEVGLLINFGSRKLEWSRKILTHNPLKNTFA
jgi:GxxExxY protein